jgi:hypothetical protein
VLRRMLLDRLEPGTVEWGTEVLGFEDGSVGGGGGGGGGGGSGGTTTTAADSSSSANSTAGSSSTDTSTSTSTCANPDEKVSVRFSNGTTEWFDVLIGAEGASSLCDISLLSRSVSLRFTPLIRLKHCCACDPMALLSGGRSLAG